MKANFNQILHQSTVRANTTPLPALSNSDQLTKISFLKKNKPETYKSVSESVKFSAGKGSVLKGSWISKRTDPIGKRLLSYLYLSLLVLFSVALGIYGYQQIFKDVVQQYAYPQAPSPTTPNRYLSFQARLTDSSDNPITVPTDFRFIVYNNETASASAKLWEEQRYIDPDQDGIFSVTLGTETAIPTTLFTENADLWLGVTVETDPEATPRQRIATVGYAINAETLQGFPPSASASADQIPVLTQEGDLVLAQANPMVYSSSGTFSIKGQCVTGDSLLPIMTRSNLVKIEPHSIKGLLDMGIQPVYKLTTEDGWTKVVYLEKGEEIAVANKESLLGNSGSLGNENNQKKNSDHQQTISHRSASQEIFGIHHNNLLLSDNANVINNPSIPNDKLGSNKLKYSPTEETPKNPGLITNIPNQPEVKLTSISLDTSITAFSEKNLINNSLDSNNSDVKFPAGRSLGVGWVKIASIEYAGEEQVYDIEVEDTHNFVANGIIYDKVQPCLHKEKSLSGSTPNQITGSRHQTKGYNNQPKIALNQHLTSLSPYKKEVHHNRKNSTSNSRQPKSISKVRFNHALTPLTNNIAKLRKTYEKVNPAAKKSNFSDDELLVKNGATIPPVNQAAAIVLKNSDTTLSWPWDNFSINQSIIHPSIDIKYIKFALAYL